MKYKQYFEDLIEARECTERRDSHRRINRAFKKLEKCVAGYLIFMQRTDPFYYICNFLFQAHCQRSLMEVCKLEKMLFFLQKLQVVFLGGVVVLLGVAIFAQRNLVLKGLGIIP